MKRRNASACAVLAGLLLTGCPFTTAPYLESIKFVDGRTIEYKIPLVIGDNASGNYGVEIVSIKPDAGYSVKYTTFSITTGRIFFNKDVEDGTVIELNFYDESDGHFNRKFLFSHTFTKGEEADGL